MGKEKLYNRLFELVGYMLTSARGLIDEPQLYGPFRLIDGVSRLCGFLDEKAGYGDFFVNLKEKIDGFVKLLDEAVMDYTEKMKEDNTT